MPNLPNLISTYCILIPIVFGLLSFKKAINLFRLFVFFLIIGFLSDFSMSQLKAANLPDPGYVVFNVYSLIEFAFFSFILYKNFSALSIKRFALIVFILAIPFWLFTHFYHATYPLGFYSKSAVFETGSASIISILSAVMLLQIVEGETDMLSNPSFWLFTGSFMYFFCSSLIFSFFGMEFSFLNQVWDFSLIFNILQYVFYTIAFFKILKSDTVQKSS